MTGSGDRIRKISRAVLCLLLAAMMIVPAALPQEAYAAGNVSVKATPGEPAQPAKTADRFTINGYDITFNEQVATDTFLGTKCFTDTLKTSGNLKSITLKWKKVKNYNNIDGYFIVRKSLTDGRWYQIAEVGNNVTTFTDKTAKKKNKNYAYTLLSFRRRNGLTKVSSPSQWASAVTLLSKKKNVTKSRLERAAKGSAVRVGGTTQVAAHFPKKPASRKIRWSSSDKKIAKVNGSGMITGVKEGTATIYGRTHAGYVIKFVVTVVRGGTAQGMIDVMSTWMGLSYYNQKNRGIVDIYNSFEPVPNGYYMGYYDAWCDCTVSAAAIVSGNVDNIGRNCSVPRHVKLFKSMGIWIEGCKTVPKPGDLIVFNWYPKSKNNASHIGIVKSVEGKTITTIEGNMGIGMVGNRTVKVGWKYIRGYARPKYTVVSPETTQN